MVCRLVVAAVLLIFSTAVSASSQTAPEKAASASISGKVTIKGKGVAGVTVFAMNQNSGRGQRSNYHTTTDQTGNYKITNVGAGTYWIRPFAPSFALDEWQPLFLLLPVLDCVAQQFVNESIL